jgi:hypothetical protein
MPVLEEVFLVSGIPTYTFVEPVYYDAMRVSLRTPGRCAVVEGPSGIGKTTSVVQLLEELGKKDEAIFLSARKTADLEYIENLPSLSPLGTVLVDDFHRLDDNVKQKLADFMKVLADEGSQDDKLVLIGINKAGDRLVDFGNDVGLRIDVFKMESNPDHKIEELIGKGEQALNVSIGRKDEFVGYSYGSFQIAQMLCNQLCLEEGVDRTQDNRKHIDIPVETIVDRVMANLRRMFHDGCVAFARGSKLRREGRAPYLHILKWLADNDDWTLDLKQAVQTRPEHKGSVGQVVEKDYLSAMLREKSELLSDLFHYQPENRTLSIEDPRLMFYLKNLVWKNFTREVGYTSDYFRSKYDIALSFAGEERPYAEQLFEELQAREVSVFYDKNEQHRIIGQNIEEYLAPIYRSEASYVVPFLSPNYPKKIWTKFESDHFKGRFGENSVIPIRFRTCSEGYFSDASEYGSLSFDPNGEVEQQIKEIAEIICRRLEEDRYGQAG